MFRSNTLFVVGAGASKEAGLPIGIELTEKIAALVQIQEQFGTVTKGDHVIYNALRELSGQPEWPENQFLKSGSDVAEAMELAQSIDTFLESHRGNREFVQLGKLGIVRAIAMAEAEAASKLMATREGQSPFQLKALTDTWYYSLARQLFTGIPADKPDRAFENVSFIVFNYDRCLQTFLARAAQVYFRLSPDKARELVGRVEFIHPYGSLGSVFEGTADHVPFGFLNFDILAAANRIQTFSESSVLSATMRQRICAANTLIFLGFGFHEQNIALMDIAQDLGVSEATPKRVFATTMGMSASDEAVVRHQISYALLGRPLNEDEQSSISTNSGTCNDLFSTYWRSLTA